MDIGTVVALLAVLAGPTILLLSGTRRGRSLFSTRAALGWQAPGFGAVYGTVLWVCALAWVARAVSRWWA